MAAAAAAAPSSGGSQDDVESAMWALFRAYDLDESGELTRDEFLKIEMRLCFEAGEVFHEDAETAKMTLADRDRSGTLDYEEFRERQLRTYHEMGLTRQEIVSLINDHRKRTLAERVKMGPRYHALIRQTLKRIFSLFDVSGDGFLSPEEWIAAQKIVAMEIGDDIDESWIDEAAFNAADLNGDGVLEESEFLEASFSMFEGVKRRTDAILVSLERIVASLERERGSDRRETRPLDIYVQARERPEFQPPHAAWQDEPTEAEMDKNQEEWNLAGTVAVPLSVQTVDEVAAIIRLMLRIPHDMWISIFFIGPTPDGGSRPVTLLRGERPGEGNVTQAMDYLSKPNATHKLYIKNVRKRPARLTRQPRCFLEERDAVLSRRTGTIWGLDWETQLVGDGVRLPPRPLVVHVGDAVVIEVPQTDDHGEYRYVSSCFMDKTDVLSKPVDENVVIKVKKKKKNASAPEPDPLLQLTLVALREGTCVFFVDVGWEDQEEKLARTHRLTAPCIENTVARVGAIEVEVHAKAANTTSSKDNKPQLVWWNGEKWSNKKGPAKKKGRRR